jgi:cytochrome oxidase assembly protein ShyY1
VHRWLLSPRWLGLHALLVLALVGTGALGWWQLDRAREHHADSLASALRADGQTADPLGTVLAGGDQVADVDTGRLVTVIGRYDSAHQLLVPDRPLDGRPGFLLVVPLRGPSGPAVMVDRGWLPAAADGTSPPVPAPPAGEQVVTGWLSGPDPMPPAGAVTAPGRVAAVNAAILANVVPYRVVDGYVHRTSPEPAAANTSRTPAAASTALTVVPPPQPRSSGTWPVQNLFYAVEWWVFGAAALWMWAVMVRHEYGDRRRALAARVDELAAAGAAGRTASGGPSGA